MIIVGLRIVFFVLSTLGSWEIVRNAYKTNVVFIPSIVIAIQFFFLFFGGLFNLLRETVYFLFLIGFLGFLYFFKKEKLDLFKNYNNYIFVILFSELLFLFLYLFGKKFVHYDNFTHWALAVKQMLNTNRFPNFKDEIIIYKEYPLGSSVFIYYFSKIISKAECIQMLAQDYMIVCFLLPIYYGIKNNKYIIYIFSILLFYFIFMINISSYDLLVDTLLPVTSFGIFIFIKEIRYELNNYLFIVISYLTLLLQIKNSGIFFFVLAAVYIFKYCYFSLKDKLFITIIPLLNLLIWHKHCDYVFDKAEYTKHAMRMGNFHQILLEKNSNDIINTLVSVLKLTLNNRYILVFVLFVIIIGGFIYAINKKNMFLYYKNTIKIVVIYIFYMVGMAGMYVFSMPQGESVGLNGSARYLPTIIIFITLIFCHMIMKVSSYSHSKNLIIILMTMLITIQIVAVGNDGILTFKKYNTEIRDQLEQIQEDYEIYDAQSITVIVDNNDNSGYIYFLTRYIYEVSDVNIIDVYLNDSEYKLNDVVIVLDNTSNVNNWIKNNIGDVEKILNFN